MNTPKDSVFALRRQLLANGYSPIPNRDKACYLKDWPKVAVDEALLKKWGRMHNATATGLRVENGLCVIDVDINHRVIEDVTDAMLSVLPEELKPERLERYGKGHKFAWYCRTDDLFARLHTRAWIAPGETEDDGTHTVEVFGGGSPRQFGSFGPHTVEQGKTIVHYRWSGESPADVPLDALDILTKDQLFAMLDAAEAELKRQGFEPVKRTTRGEGVPHREYDLTRDMQFELKDGYTVGLDELQTMVRNGYTGNCSASWLDGPVAKNRNRCLISQSSAGHLTIWESAAGVTHMPAAIKPSNPTEQVDRIAEKLREKQDKRRSRLVDGDDHVSGAAKLLVSYAYMPTSRAPVVPLWSISNDEAVTLTNFRTQMQPYCGEEVGPRGGVTKINPVDVWLSNANRVVVAWQRMRPDKERPVYDEHGRTWLNTYRPPDLGPADGGTADGGIALLEQLVPDERERRWFRQWLAFKWKNPHVPSVAVVMVARDFGTGRGTFGDLLKLMFGNQYVVNVPFKIFAGLNYQSQYTDWGLDALFAIVNESSATDGQSAYRVKHDVYEHIKEVVEPRPVERTYIRKSEGSVRAIASTSTLILTNHKDAIPMPEDDRRLAVLTNGKKRDPEFWAYINEWMQSAANLAAFAQYLESTDLASYDPFNPIDTNAKEDMVFMNKSPLDVLVEDALQAMDGYFVVEQALRHIADADLRAKNDLPDNWRAIATREIRKLSYCVRYENGRKCAPSFNSRRYDVLHCDENKAKKLVNVSDLRQLLGKNGNVFGSSENENGKSEHRKRVVRLVKGDR